MSKMCQRMEDSFGSVEDALYVLKQDIWEREEKIRVLERDLATYKETFQKVREERNKLKGQVQALKFVNNSCFGLPDRHYNIDIHPDDIKILISAMDVYKEITERVLDNPSNEIHFMLDNMQRIKDGFTELLEYGGR